MLRVAYVVLLAQMSLSGILFAQAICPVRPPPYGLLRQDEDYRFLRNPTCRRDNWDRFKYVPLGSNEDRFITVGGEVREWYEGFDNAIWGLGSQDDSGYLLQRLSTYADIHAAPRVRFFVQLTSGIEAGRNGGPRPVIDESKLFFEEAFVDLTLSKTRKEEIVLRLGRQEFEFGSGRLVNAREGPNVRQAFDGGSLKWKTPSWTVDALAAKPVLNGTGVLDAPPNHGSTFWGVYAVRPLNEMKGGNVDLYYLGLARKSAPFERGSQNEVRHTVGVRYWGGKNAWTYNSEATFQWGTFGANDIRAWATAHDTAYTFRSIPLQPGVGLDVGVVSGDHGNSKSALGTFNPLFPTGIYFGQGALALNGPSNLIAIGPHVSLQLTKSLTLQMDDHTFLRTSLEDGVYGLGINLLIAGRGNSGRYIGNQPTMGVYWNASRHFSVSGAYGRFLVGPFLANASPPGKDVNYAGVWTTYKF
ncbi:MAG TPA: alginate export family protein [Acidobacteriaceae bacterium]|jgi:hypothetical protein